MGVNVAKSGINLAIRVVSLANSHGNRGHGTMDRDEISN